MRSFTFIHHPVSPLPFGLWRLLILALWASSVATSCYNVPPTDPEALSTQDSEIGKSAISESAADPALDQDELLPALIAGRTFYRRGLHDQAQSVLRDLDLGSLRDRIRHLQVISPALSLALDREIHLLRQEFASGQPFRRVETRHNRVQALIAKSGSQIGKSQSFASMLWTAFRLTFLGGLDGLALAIAVLCISRRRDALAIESRTAMAGLVMGAISIALWVVLWPKFGQVIGGAQRSYLHFSLSAATVLGILPLLALTIRYFRWPPALRYSPALTWLVVLFALPFLAMSRDALDLAGTIALQGLSLAPLIGVILGTSLLAIVGLATLRATRIPKHALAVASSCTLIALVGIQSAGSLLQSAQVIGLAPSTAAGNLVIPALSFYPSHEGVSAQLAMSVLLALGLLVGITWPQKSKAKNLL